MRSASIVLLLFLLCAMVSAWFFLQPRENLKTRAPSRVPHTTSLAKTVRKSLSPKAEEINRDRLAIEKQTPLSPSAVAAFSTAPHCQIRLLHAETNQAIAGALVAVFALSRKTEQPWLDTAWLTSPGSEEGEAPTFLLQSDAQGLVQLPLPSYRYGITASSENLFGMQVPPVLGPNTTTPLLLWPDRAIEILVQDADGKPLGEIPVKVVPSGGGWPPYLGMRNTDCTGHTTFPHILTRARQIPKVSFLSIATPMTWNIAPLGPWPLFQLPAQIILTAPPTGRLVVKLEDSKGNPFLQDCIVQLGILPIQSAFEVRGTTPPPFSGHLEALSHNGTVTFENVGLDLDLLVSCDWRGEQTESEALVVRAPRLRSTLTEVVLQQQKSGTVYPFLILNENNDPLPFTELDVVFRYNRGKLHHGSYRRTLTTDSEGLLRWHMQPMEEQTESEIVHSQKIRFALAANAQHPQTFSNIDLPPQTQEGLQPTQKIRLLPLPLLAQGTVFDSRATPLPGAMVSLQGRGTAEEAVFDFWMSAGVPVFTDSAGKFKLRAKTGKIAYRLQISHSEYASQIVSLGSNPEEDLRILLRPVKLISGRVLLDPDISPQSLEAYLYAKAANGAPVISSAPLDAQARFRFQRNNNDPLGLEIRAGKTAAQSLWLQKNLLPMPPEELQKQPYALIDLRGSIKHYLLQVVDEKGQPIAGAKYRFLEALKKAQAQSFPTRLGNVMFLGNGNPIALAITAPAKQSTEITLKAGQPQKIKLLTGFDVHFQVVPPPVLPPNCALLLSLERVDNSSKVLLQKDEFTGEGTLVTQVPGPGSYRTKLLLKRSNSILSALFPIEHRGGSWESIVIPTLFSVEENGAAPSVKIPLHLAAWEAALKLSDSMFENF